MSLAHDQIEWQYLGWILEKLKFPSLFSISPDEVCYFSEILYLKIEDLLNLLFYPGNYVKVIHYRHIYSSYVLKAYRV